MKKLLFRIGAFILDLGLASLIICGLCMLDFINPHSDELNRMYKAYYKESIKISNLDESVNKYFEDETLDQNEYNEVLSFYSEYKDCFKDVNNYEKVTTGDINKVKESISKTSMELMNKRVIEINKLKYMDTIVSLVVFILYFGVLQYALKGQTPFKRIFRIKVVNESDSKKTVSLFSYIVRSLLVSEVIISLLDLGFLFMLSQNSYVNVHYWLTQAKYIYEMAFLVCMVIRDDSRSIHDVILNTRVLRYDKSGREVVEQLFSDDDEKNIVKTN